MNKYYLLKNGVRVQEFDTRKEAYEACISRYDVNGPITWAIETVEVEK